MQRLISTDNQKYSMVLIYNLKEDLEKDPEHVELAQKLTLDESRPLMGLKGTHGLFGSDEWWDSIYNKKMKLLFVSGVITRTYYAGQDSDRRHNSYELTLDNGSLHQESFYANNKDYGLYVIGKKVSIVYALDELKRQDRKNKYTRTPIEIAISKKIVPVEKKQLTSCSSGSKKVFPPVPDWKPDIAQPIELIIEKIKYYTDNKKDIAVFKNGTCVVLDDNLTDSNAQQFAKEVLHQIYNFHPDMNPINMDDGNILIKYNHPAVNVVLDSHAKEHWSLIDKNHQQALSTDEVLITPLGNNVFDDFGKKALFGRCFMFMDAQKPEVIKIVRKTI